MKKRNILTTGAALAAAAFAARLAILTAMEWRRENKMREMSDEGPLGPEVPGLLLESLVAERAFVVELGKFLIKFPIEMARYFKAESM